MAVTAKPRRGRPSLDPQGGSGRPLPLRTSLATRAALEAEAESQGLPVGTVARRVLDAWATRRRRSDRSAYLVALTPPETDSNVIAAAAINAVRQARAEGLDPAEIVLTVDGKPVSSIPVPRGRF